ncbi:MAG: hypothetical protein HY689_16335 [Chloroflexi bacterium]|nr:hypothetical protein [Chloroflexota bacterium]
MEELLRSRQAWLQEREAERRGRFLGAPDSAQPKLNAEIWGLRLDCECIEHDLDRLNREIALLHARVQRVL